MSHHLRRRKKVSSFLAPRQADSSSNDKDQSTELLSGGTVQKLLEVILGDPWNDYEYLYHLDQVIVAKRRSKYFDLVHIRKCRSSDAMEHIRALSSIQGPNIATVHNVFCDGDEVFVVTERLDLVFPQLEIQRYEMDEWEIATIIAEVLKGVALISSFKISCKSLSEANIGFSLNGAIKIIPDVQLERDHLHQSPKSSQVLLDFPIIAELIEDMMLSRFHLSSKWSEHALGFLSCTLTGSLENLKQHRFLNLAVSPRRLIPRIRFAFGMSRECPPKDDETKFWEVETNDVMEFAER